jgi:alkanesulfonate monooxygenase SsuD/methylene tetrahydromethanopterin reductase-like flavin-dependent oxidoreductase (luciferase family)
VNLGLYFDLRNPPEWHRDWARVYGFALELCEQADRGGIHSLWFTEHHLFEDGYLPQPLTFAAAAAARTTRARIGTSIMIAGLRPAVQIAEEAAVVDIISGGRLELGLGAGYRRPEFELFGADPQRPHALLYARVEELRKIWTEGRVTPPPVQVRVPIWLGVSGPKGARRAGELGEGLLRISHNLLAPYHEGLAAGGHAPGTARISGPVNLFLSDDPERDWPIVRKHVAYQWNSYARYRLEGTGEAPPPPIDPEAWRERGIGRGLMNGFSLATPQEAAELLTATVAGTGASSVHLWASVAGVPEALAERNVELAIDELAPLLAGVQA